MIETPIPDDETLRLDALHSLDLLDTPAEVDFEAVVELGRALFEVPICTVTLIDTSRQWFKARRGLAMSQTERSISFCGHAILGRAPLVVLNALDDDRFKDNPLVVEKPSIRFYAGHPIWLPNGYPIGTVCVISDVPRAQFTAEDQKRLADLAVLAAQAIAVRGLRKELDRLRHQAGLFGWALRSAPAALAFADADGALMAHSAHFDELYRRQPHEEPRPDLSQWVAALIVRAVAANGPVALPDQHSAIELERNGEGYLVIARPGADRSERTG